MPTGVRQGLGLRWGVTCSSHWAFSTRVPPGTGSPGVSRGRQRRRSDSTESAATSVACQSTERSTGASGRWARTHRAAEGPSGLSRCCRPASPLPRRLCAGRPRPALAGRAWRGVCQSSATAWRLPPAEAGPALSRWPPRSGISFPLFLSKTKVPGHLQNPTSSCPPAQGGTAAKASRAGRGPRPRRCDIRGTGSLSSAPVW